MQPQQPRRYSMTIYRHDHSARPVSSYVVALFYLAIFFTLVFGNPLRPIYFFFFSLDKLPLIVIVSSIVGGYAIGAAAIRLGRLKYQQTWWRRNAEPTFFVLAAMSGWLLLASTELEIWRMNEIMRFDPDEVYTKAFIRSLSQAPAEDQLYLHGGALKDCIPYAWSYSEMQFYKLPGSIAANVLPDSWIVECDITRS